jgi:hypothetical protein
MCFSDDRVKGKYKFKIPPGVKLKVDGNDKDGWAYYFEWDNTYLSMFECIPRKGAPGLKEDEISSYIDDLEKDLKNNKFGETFKKEKVKLGLFSGYGLLLIYKNILGNHNKLICMLWDGKRIWSMNIWTHSKDNIEKVKGNVKKAKDIIKSARLNKLYNK